MYKFFSSYYCSKLVIAYCVFVYLKKSKLRFLDTMSLHIAVCGQTSFQRVLYQASKKGTNRKDVREYLEVRQVRNQQVKCHVILC